MNFLNYLLETQKKQFKGLSEQEKTEIMSVFETRTFTSPREAQTIFESFVNPINEEKWISEMPSKYKDTWNSLTESQKDVFKSQASLRVLETKEAIDYFWSTRDLKMFERNNLILEGKETNTINNKDEQSDRMKFLTEQMMKRFGK